MNQFTIGDLAKKLNTTAVTIRHYERCGLLTHAERSQGGYRLYTESELDRLRFILNARRVGFELDEVLELINIQNNPKGSKKDVKQMVLAKLECMIEKRNILVHLINQLEQLAQCCDGKGPLSECPILKTLHKKNTKPSEHENTSS